MIADITPSLFHDYYFNISASFDGEKILVAKKNKIFNSNKAIDIAIYKIINEQYFEKRLWSFKEFEQVKFEWSSDNVVFLCCQKNQLLLFKEDELIFNYTAENKINSAKFYDNKCYFIVSHCLFIFDIIENNLKKFSIDFEREILNECLFPKNINSDVRLYLYNGNLTLANFTDNHRAQLLLFILNETSFYLEKEINILPDRPGLFHEIYFLHSDLIVVKKIKSWFSIFHVNEAGGCNELFKNAEVEWIEQRGDAIYLLMHTPRTSKDRAQLVKLTQDGNQIVLNDLTDMNFLPSLFTIDQYEKIYFIGCFMGSYVWQLFSLSKFDTSIKKIAAENDREPNQKNIYSKKIFEIDCYSLNHIMDDNDIVFYIPSPVSFRYPSAQAPFFQHMVFELLINFNQAGLNIIVPDLFSLQYKKDFTTSVNKLVMLIQQLAKTTKRGKICLLTASLGGYITSHLLGQVNQSISSALFLSPVVNKNVIPDDIYASFYSGEHNAVKKDNHVSSSVFVYHGSDDPVSSIGDVSEFLTAITCPNKILLTVWDEAHVFKEKNIWENFFRKSFELLKLSEIEDMEKLC